MKAKNNIKAKTFPDVMMKRWENSDGIDFAIALARLTGWMLQVDWLTTEQHADVENMTPVRVYVETNRDVVFDFTGKKGIMAFNKYVIQPIAGKRTRTPTAYIDTRCYSEQALRELPLRVKANDTEIEKATSAISAHPTFLDTIPKRQNPEIPAYLASKFSHGNCVPFADALMNLTGLPAAGIDVMKYADECGSRLGFCHAIIIHPDGQVEDAWGKQPLSEVLERFYIKEYTMSATIFEERKAIQSREYPDRYQDAYKLAISFLKDHSLVLTNK
ncbi:hypothetical protein [Pedobacter hiemivivus]|uniref:Uncharacterized protein n=1 Tax=Pedobacter hiemivivus TaxID=2530454 RepID=A0A4R0NIU2_9SPHI|nr:hypothetical protein [Pedobacter hiemivivus]TCC98774.1 hypothetical protein EZ444_05730 [Pedobacter hiemivivus]